MSTDLSEKIYMAVEMELGEDYGELVGALLYGPTGGALGANPLTIFSGGVDPAGTVNTNIYGQNSKSWSVFTHNTFKITDQLGLTVGLRYSDERKSGLFEQGPNSNALCPAILNSIATGGVPAALANSVFGTGCLVFTTPADLPQAGVFPLPRTFNEKFKDTELIYTGKISYAFDAPVNVYASFTHGYKAGGFNLDSTASISGADPRFKSEKVNAYEVGLKAKMIDGAVMFNLAAFREDFTNFQVLEFTGTQFRTFNVPKARTSGLELESIIRPSDNLTVNMAVTYIDANYPSDCAGTETVINVVALCGASLTSAPALVGIAGVTYTKDLGNYLDFFVTAQARMSGDERTSTQKYNTAITTSRVLVPFDQQDGNTKINLRAGIGAQDDSWALEVFGTNITNQLTRGVTFSTALRSGSRSAYIQEPRSYGVTLRTKF